MWPFRRKQKDIRKKKVTFIWKGTYKLGTHTETVRAGTLAEAVSLLKKRALKGEGFDYLVKVESIGKVEG